MFISTSLYADKPWKLVRSEQGIEIFLKKVDRSDYKMFRGEAVISAQIDAVMNALTHSDSCSLWRDNCKAFISLGDNYRLLINDLPWPLSDRFVVTQTTLTDATRLEIRHVAVKNLPAAQAMNIPDHDGMVEMKEYSGYWKLETIDSDKLKVIFQMQVNPAGNIPAAVINRGIVNSPFNTLVSLRELVEMNSK